MAERDFDPSQEACKVFITNIEGSQSEEMVQEQLRKLFDKFGRIVKLSVKKNKNGLYYFAFLSFEAPDQAFSSIQALDQCEIFGKRMRVRQDRQSQGCFHCKKAGHFAKQCPEKTDKNEDSRAPRNPEPYPSQPYHDYRERGHYEGPYREEAQNGRYDRERDHRYGGERDQRHRHGYEARDRYEGRYRDQHQEYGARQPERYGRRQHRDQYGHGHRQQRHRKHQRSPSYQQLRRHRYQRSRSDSRDRYYRVSRGHHNGYDDWKWAERRERRVSTYRKRSPRRRSPSSGSYSSRR